MKGDLRWRCRRGMRELDTLFTHFLDHHYDDLPVEIKDRFAAWLDLPDPTLWGYLTGPLPEDPIDQALARRLRSYSGFLPDQDSSIPRTVGL